MSSLPIDRQSRDNRIYRKMLNRLISLELTRVFRSRIEELAELLTEPKRGEYMMNTLVRLMLVCMLILVAAPAYAAEATQMWKCEMNDDTTEEEVIAIAHEWLKAARKMEGGERLEAQVLFPVAVNAIGQVDAFLLSSHLLSKSGVSSGITT